MQCLPIVAGAGRYKAKKFHYPAVSVHLLYHSEIRQTRFHQTDSTR